MRNEVTITLAGEERIMRATFTAIVAIEKQLGKGMTAIISQIADGDLSITESAYIIYHGLRGYDDKRLTFDQVGDGIVAAGIGNISMAVVEFVSKALSGVSVGKPETPEAAN